jgi:hypothetical protein
MEHNDATIGHLGVNYLYQEYNQWNVLEIPRIYITFRYIELELDTHVIDRSRGCWSIGWILRIVQNNNNHAYSVHQI